jgi:hypothetical protein
MLDARSERLDLQTYLETYANRSPQVPPEGAPYRTEIIAVSLAGEPKHLSRSLLLSFAPKTTYSAHG